MKKTSSQSARSRKGNIVVLTAFMMVFLLGLMAFAVDLGYMAVVRAQLQQSADAAALAAAAELVDKESFDDSVDLATEVDSARSLAIQYAAWNKICKSAPTLDGNFSNSVNGNVVVGNLWNPSDPDEPLSFTDPNYFNAVQVRVSRTLAENGEVPLFFGPVFGYMKFAMQSSATAALITSFGGFHAPGDGSNLQMLPFALDKDTWDGLMSGGGTDLWKWNSSSSNVTGGTDGIREVNLYPQGTGSPGNRGTVDIGSSNNSTNDIARQIVDGISASDLSYFPNGELKFNAQGKLYLNGDTGISAGVKDELASIIGEPRIIPIFESVTGPGNNAEYTIVQFAGVRIMEVVLTGSMSNKRLVIQPCAVNVKGGIASSAGKSNFMYSPVWLVR
jgi:Flp pilus assembly protein TadG